MGDVSATPAAGIAATLPVLAGVAAEGTVGFAAAEGVGGVAAGVVVAAVRAPKMLPRIDILLYLCF